MKRSVPGVYVEEVSSGARRITGVATSITAFVGRALRGPVNAPVTICSFAEYQRAFGGLWNNSPMSFAVQQYFENGGERAIVVRVENKAMSATVASRPRSTGPVTFPATAANPGAWGNTLRLRIDHDVDSQFPATVAVTMFNLHVKDLATGVIEAHRNVSIRQTHARFVGSMLANTSDLLSGFSDSVTARPDASGDVPPGGDPFEHSSTTRLSGGSDGRAINASVVSASKLAATQSGLYALDKADLFNILCIPPFTPNTDVDKKTWDAAITYATKRRAVVLVDPPFTKAAAPWTSAASVTSAAIPKVAVPSGNAAMYFPRLRVSNPLRKNRIESYAPSGAVAGVIARTDAAKGVWKAPAGMNATLRGVRALDVNLTDNENGAINPLGVNCLRVFPNAGPVIWGARTLMGADGIASEWKYLTVRRTSLFIEESIDRGTQWVVFEPNDEPLWKQIRISIDAFLQTLFRQGAFKGNSRSEAYFVKCDRETTTQNDIQSGIVNIVVGFAPLKPAEFVVITLAVTGLRL